MMTELFLKLRKSLDNQNDGKRKVFLDLLDLINLSAVKTVKTVLLSRVSAVLPFPE